jgi:hypothetical protein
VLLTVLAGERRLTATHTKVAQVLRYRRVIALSLLTRVGIASAPMGPECCIRHVTTSLLPVKMRVRPELRDILLLQLIRRVTTKDQCP